MAMYDVDGNEVTIKDLQNKGAWCAHGVEKENIFITNYGEHLNLQINPRKAFNQFVPDLSKINSAQSLADLKTQNTPFFTAEQYDYAPQFTVTFNKKDADRYRKNYPGIDIYFWVDWVAVRYFKESTNPRYGNTDVRVEPMNGVWKVSFNDLDQIIKTSPLHLYQQRKNDSINAKESYLIDLNNEKIVKVI